ncbi:MAG: sigma-70 family RNA polymerase sigma factor [Puniceicoccales bacterium]|jgi:RNA polymerase sigma-70 factor (ECF subfamily)|nr:sigma-70 family RNA polymerase sigma factor [Puniceicoccales bacterium]
MPVFVVQSVLPNDAVSRQPERMAPFPEPPPEVWFDSFFRGHQPALLAYARNLVHDDATAADIVQDSFLRLWKTRPDPAFARAWLFRVCRTRAIDWWRKKRALPAADFGKEGENTPDFFERLPDESAEAPNETLVRDETAAALLREVDSLPKRQRELVRLKFQAGLSYREIADTAGLSVTNVGFILHTALETLRKKMNPASHNL